MTAAYEVQTDSFTGPLELLLSLVEKRKLFINDVSLAKVADDFIEYTKKLESYPMAESAHFILVASTLILLKSKSLLPTLSLSKEEEGDIEELEQRLALYKQTKTAAEELRKRFGTAVMFALRERPLEPVFSADPSITVPNLRQAAYSVISEFPKEPTFAKAVVQSVVSLEEVIDRLKTRISEALSMSFHDFSGMGKAEKVDVVVSFLALLELIKQGAIRVRQDRRFDDIMIESDSVGTPRY